ncbi:uncharacterized protein MONOS_365 [Monocercomonoides exilis]|uniref:uncharacterized protein n=1 Tax=Monocercomonoides exilis TaxID=2049356 RepID=UPI00355A8597|nr:hypothetical protein MONOS_365 [Monocercomonoides exilis]|eukprot:MONOS_365.1-p1 / transcript=MONOS_365.1 / gene=MONOS_365 / organism=Monocercomonoides_exilis_PA203 / gene_product=unspecified product / transcript_product=unspecified product / location=Mono_scaffold00006:62431-63275(+) / protein_length=162 / sequence_SO=supercontig / SO=protein_coding / is_pseudo=false
MKWKNGILTYIIERGRFKKPRKTSKEILLKFSEHCWEKLSDKQVAHFEALAQIDQERYEAELRVFHPKRSDLHLMATPLMSLPKEPLILSPETKKPLFTVITGRLPPLHILTNCIILLLKKIEPETAISCRMIRKRLEQEFNVSFRHRKRMIEVILLTLIE